MISRWNHVILFTSGLTSGVALESWNIGKNVLMRPYRSVRSRGLFYPSGAKTYRRKMLGQRRVNRKCKPTYKSSWGARWVCNFYVHNLKLRYDQAHRCTTYPGENKHTSRQNIPELMNALGYYSNSLMTNVMLAFGLEKHKKRVRHASVHSIVGL